MDPEDAGTIAPSVVPAFPYSRLPAGVNPSVHLYKIMQIISSLAVWYSAVFPL